MRIRSVAVFEARDRIGGRLAVRFREMPWHALPGVERGTVEGAIATGLRAAKQVVARHHGSSSAHTI